MERRSTRGFLEEPAPREVIMIRVALDWLDECFPANAGVSRRRAVDEVARFVGVDV